MSQDDNKRNPAPNHRGSDNSAPYPVSRMAPAVELVDMAREIASADNMLTTVAHSKLKVIAEQMKALQQEAQHILQATRRDQQLHRAQCNFQRIPGRVYHLYCKADGRRYFSMLSPEEWGGPVPHRYEGSYRLENDMSWTPAEAMDQPDDTRVLIDRLLDEQ